jgi:hypothetical protein
MTKRGRLEKLRLLSSYLKFSVKEKETFVIYPTLAKEVVRALAPFFKTKRRKKK